MLPPATMPDRRRLSSLLLALCGCLFASCSSTPKFDPIWVHNDVNAPSDRILQDTASEALRHLSFAAASGWDPAKREQISAWHLDLVPFGRVGSGGWRKRAVVRYEPIGPGRYRVSVRVEAERNNDIARPHDPAFADWEEAPDDEILARDALLRIRGLLMNDLEEINEPPNPFEHR